MAFLLHSNDVVFFLKNLAFPIDLGKWQQTAKASGRYGRICLSMRFCFAMTEKRAHSLQVLLKSPIALALFGQYLQSVMCSVWSNPHQ